MDISLKQVHESHPRCETCGNQVKHPVDPDAVTCQFSSFDGMRFHKKEYCPYHTAFTQQGVNEQLIKDAL